MEKSPLDDESLAVATNPRRGDNLLAIGCGVTRPAIDRPLRLPTSVRDYALCWRCLHLVSDRSVFRSCSNEVSGAIGTNPH